MAYFQQPVSHFKMRIIKTHMQRLERRGTERGTGCGARTHAAQGCGNLATYGRCVRVSGTQTDKYGAGNSQRWTGEGHNVLAWFLQ